MYHVAFCFDKNFQQHACAAISSVILNFGKSPSDLSFHLIIDQADDHLATIIDTFKTRFGCRFKIYSIANQEKEVLERIPHSLRNMHHFSIAAYFRLLLPSLVSPDIKKILYLDSDIIALDDISKLIDTDLDGKALGLVLDPKSDFLAKANDITEYFNSGVALFDLDMWRSHDLATRCIGYLEKPSKPVRQADQCAINMILNGNIKEIDPRWNGFTYNTCIEDGKYDNIRNEYAIIHYFTQHKPWQSWYQNSLGEYYWLYLDVSPWKGAKRVQPKSVNEHVWLARKLKEEGKLGEAVTIYEKVVTHFLSKSA